MFDSIKFCNRRIKACETELALAEANGDKELTEKLKEEIEKYTRLLDYYSNNK